MRQEDTRRVSRRSTPAMIVNPAIPRRLEDIVPPGTRTVVDKGDTLVPTYIDFTKWDMTSQLRYCEHYNITLPQASSCPKSYLVEVVANHSACVSEIREAEIIAEFLQLNDRDPQGNESMFEGGFEEQRPDESDSDF